MDAQVVTIDPLAREALPGLWAVGQVIEHSAATAPRPVPEPRDHLDAAWTLDGLRDDEVAAGFRKVSWRVGVDPTKNRPSGEALARRLLAGRPLPTILPLVDAYNAASATTLVPIGAYDLDHAQTPITIRPAHIGETFHGIGREPETIAPGRIVYADADGTICGVFMWRDAMATRVREESSRVLLLSVGGDPVPVAHAEQAIQRAADWSQAAGFVAKGSMLRA